MEIQIHWENIANSQWLELTSNVTFVKIVGGRILPHFPERAASFRIPSKRQRSRTFRSAGETPALQRIARQDQRSNCDNRVSRFDSSTRRSGAFPEESDSTSSNA